MPPLGQRQCVKHGRQLRRRSMRASCRDPMGLSRFAIDHRRLGNSVSTARFEEHPLGRQASSERAELCKSGNEYVRKYDVAP